MPKRRKMSKAEFDAALANQGEAYDEFNRRWRLLGKVPGQHGMVNAVALGDTTKMVNPEYPRQMCEHQFVRDEEPPDGFVWVQVLSHTGNSNMYAYQLFDISGCLVEERTQPPDCSWQPIKSPWAT